MENYDLRPNSHKYKAEQAKQAEQEKKVEKIVTGKVITKKKTGFQKIADSFINEDMPKVKDYILKDVLVPSLKKAISDIVRNGIDMLLYGETSSSRKRLPGEKASYRQYWDNPSRDRREPVREQPARYGLDYDFVLESRGQAEGVLDQMEDLIDRYGIVSVADLYDMVGESTKNHCTHNYGWTNLIDAKVVRVQDGYWIKLPKALPID